VKPTPHNQPNERELELTPTTSKEEESVPVGQSGEEDGHESDHAASKGEVKSVFVSPLKDEGPECTPAASEKKTEPAPVDPPKEEGFGSTPAPLQEMKSTQSKDGESERAIVTLKEETLKEKAPLRPTLEEGGPNPASHPPVKAGAIAKDGPVCCSFDNLIVGNHQGDTKDQADGEDGDGSNLDEGGLKPNQVRAVESSENPLALVGAHQVLWESHRV